jgi:L-seryl-tRNA(Ser) seleniumtransferase
MSYKELRSRARRFHRRLRAAAPAASSTRLVEGRSVVGGGSCPGANLPATLIALDSEQRRPNEIASHLRSQSPPVIVRIEADAALVDLRTVFPAQEPVLIKAIGKALA